jgi:hypothetical protein
VNAQTPEPPALTESEIRDSYALSGEGADFKSVYWERWRAFDTWLAARDAAWAERLKDAENDRDYWRTSAERCLAELREVRRERDDLRSRYENAEADKARAVAEAKAEGARAACRAVEAWVMKNEIAAPPLDWDGLGSVLDVLDPARALREEVGGQ